MQKVKSILLNILRLGLVGPVLIVLGLLAAISPKLFVAVVKFFDWLSAPRNIRILLKSKDAMARAGAAYDLGEANHPRAVLPLIEALRDEDATVRVQAALSLGILADKRALPALEWMRDNDTGVSRYDYAANKVAGEAIEAINKGIRKPRSVKNFGWP